MEARGVAILHGLLEGMVPLPCILADVVACVDKLLPAAPCPVVCEAELLLSLGLEEEQRVVPALVVRGAEYRLVGVAAVVLPVLAVGGWC